MLAEIKDARQIEGEGFRRWFRDQECDLIVWYTDDRATEIEGFQFCYDIPDHEHALTWRKKNGYQHHSVDDGELPHNAKMSPVLVQDGVIDVDRVHDLFRSVAANLDPELVNLVSTKIAAAPTA